MVYLITYDLKTPGKDYNTLYDEIKSIGENYHPLESTWFVKSSLTANRLSTKLRVVRASAAFFPRTRSARRRTLRGDWR